jgi:hypothetical protein
LFHASVKGSAANLALAVKKRKKVTDLQLFSAMARTPALALGQTPARFYSPIFT